MNRLLIATIIGLVSLSAIADGRKSVNETKQVSPDGFVSIHVTRGDLNVAGWDRDVIEITGLLDEQTREFIFEVDGDQTEIRVRLPGHLSGWSSNSGSDLRIFVPVGNNVNVRGVSTDVDVRNLHSGLEVNDVSGDMTVSNVDRGADLTTVSGEISLRNATGKIRVRSVSGDIESRNAVGPGSYHSVSGSIDVNGAGSEIDVETVSGEIDVRATEIMELSGHTVSGDIDITTSLVADGTVDLRTISGTIDLDLPSDTNARFDVMTGSGGTIRNRLTDAKPRVSKYSRDSSLRFTMREGDGEVILSTSSGRIVLGR
jgi:uncharacterized protein YdeI (BOF family)